ncbi:MAG TPA: hypothetical protein VD828_02910, partial [Candidatus Nitrosotenuis sp.]|nr:hypothetical protein [Candidatus Nitrosotenuis sp.]
LSQSIANRNIDRNALLSISGPQIHSIIGLAQLQYLEYLFSVSYAILNDTTNGWLVNLHLILFVEQVEVLGLFWFYKRMFKPIPQDTA